MQIASLVLAAAALGPSGPIVSQTAEPALAPSRPAAQAAPGTIQRPGTPAASRRFGIGANVTAGTRSAGGSMRYWFGDRLGAELNGIWYRPIDRSGVDHTSAWLIAPSAVYMFTAYDEDKDVNLRPYVGAGVNYARASVPVTQAPDGRVRGAGGQVFGGGELTFHDVPNISISVDLVHYWLPESFYNSRAGLRRTQVVGSIFVYF